MSDQHAGMGDVPGQPSHHSGFVALVGRPNAGKSTLLNACYGGKIAITSNVAQTTRRRMRAVINTDDTQVVIVDTPGLHKPQDALGKELNRAALSSLADVDVAAFLVDATKPVGRGDEWVASHVEASGAPYKLLVITKADLVEPERAAAQLHAAAALAHFDEGIIVSAKEGFNVDVFLRLVSAHLPLGPSWFPEDMDVDMTDEELVAEFVREKVLLNLREEVPHSVGVVCDGIEWAKDGHASVRATIVVEREGQKGIVIGHKGAMIKRIGISARRDVERLLDAPCYLDLRVQVRPAWRRDQSEIRRMGLSVEE
ncbi:GTPase Era [Olsenella massiliensis]|uniref:GTPase Era n=1 Tax=Olsenella massiliensis TaxID=1622075 RepID=UPI00071C7CF5|nr:GTPase Era [Olsenella massiliensis]